MTEHLAGRDLDRAIAEAKGYPVAGDAEDKFWLMQTRPGGMWLSLARWSSEWALAGPLLEEMAASGPDEAESLDGAIFQTFDDWTPNLWDLTPERIARAWLAWRTP